MTKNLLYANKYLGVKIMVIVACIDKSGNIALNTNGQLNHIIFWVRLKVVSNEALLYMNFNSSRQFGYYPMKMIDDDFLDIAGEDSYCFVEDTDITPYIDRIDKIILYKWNKKFSSKFEFDKSILDNFSVVSKKSFYGEPFLKISEIVYEKNN